jgi:hypothetical protein
MQLQTSLAYAVIMDKSAKPSMEQCRNQQPSNLRTRTDTFAQKNLGSTNYNIFLLQRLK